MDTDTPYLSRADLFGLMNVNLVPKTLDLEALTLQAIEDRERVLWQDHIDDTISERGDHWHTSFHASSFPGEEKSCARAALYSMMNIPENEPVNALGRSVMHMGKALEELIVDRWHRAGLTIAGAAPLDTDTPAPQIRFRDPAHWLTGSGDQVLNPPGYGHPLPVDVKGKDHNIIDEMKWQGRSYDEGHYGQIQAYIHFAREIHDDMGWADMGLKPAKDGALFYCSRNRPVHNHAFIIPYDEEFIARGLANLDMYKAAFLFDVLPPRDPSWRWTETPCDWCPFKKFACKPDIRNDVSTLSGSGAIAWAKNIAPSYDYEDARRRVLERWTKGESSE